jgi:hypothetical protein
MPKLRAGLQNKFLRAWDDFDYKREVDAKSGLGAWYYQFAAVRC